MLAFLLVLLSVQATDTIVLKSGKVLEGTVQSFERGIFDFKSATGESLPLSRAHIRAIEGTSRFADPKILWRNPPQAESAIPEKFLRVREGNVEQNGALEIGTALYELPESNRRIYLVGVVHIAHEAYFQELQHLLDSMDLVLWEGVGGGEKPSREAVERFDVLFKAQQLLKNLLNLDFQLEKIDYKRSFWRNCDVSANALQASLKEKNLEIIPNEKIVQSLLGAVFRVIDPAKIPRDEETARQYRALAAPFLAEMSDPDSMFSKIGASGLKEVILDERNRYVMESLKKRLAEPGPQRIAIFYGAGHLAGMDKILREEMKAHYRAMHWSAAWKL